MIYNCSFCNYFTERKYNFLRHNDNKHKEEIVKLEKIKKIGNEQKVEVFEQKVEVSEQKVEVSEQKVEVSEQRVLQCYKCNKKYKTKKHLSNHESNCKGIDELTCPKCMKTFPSKSAKCHHVKRNTCKARSIIHSRIPNLPNLPNIQNIQNINNTTNNIGSITNNLFINNFGSERIDHISHDDIVKMLTSGMNTIPLYIEKKHFDKEFPENNNITFTNENKCKVLENNLWKEKDIISLSSKLIHDNSEVLLLYCEDNELKLSNVIQDEEKYKFIKNKLFIVYDKSDNQKYNDVLKKIKDLVKNSKLQ